MRKLFTFCLLFFIGIAAFSQENKDFYNQKWLKVYRLELKDLPKSALEVVDSIFNYAKASQNDEQRLKALLYQSKFALILEEDAELKVVNQFREEIQKSTGIAKSILHNYLAEMYFGYLKRNQWQIFRRTKTENKIDSVDFRTWDIQTLLAEADTQFKLSLKDFNPLNTNKLSDYNALINRFDSVDRYRPTLFDILTHNAIDFYKTGYSSYYLKKAYTYAYEKHHFGELNTLELPETDSIPMVEVLKLYKKVYAYHQARKDTNVYVKADLERLMYVFSLVDKPTFHNTYFKALDRLRKTLNDHEAVALIDFEKATRYFNMGDKPKVIEICNQVIANYPKSDGAYNCHVLKKHIEIREMQLTVEQFIEPQLSSKILLEYKNFDSLYLKIYRLSQDKEEVYADLADSSKLRFIKSLPLDHAKFNKLIDPGDYESHTTEVVIPELETGAYIILASLKESPDDEEVFAYQKIQVTSIALIKGTMNNQKRFQLVDRSTGAPIEGGQIQLKNDPNSNYNIRYNKLIETDAQGFAWLPLPDSYIPILADVYYKGDTIDFGSYYLNQQYRPTNKQNTSDYVTAKAVLFTDRSIYRPGQTLFYKGILLKKSGQQTSILTGEYVEVYFEDVNGEEVGFNRIKVNEYGSFSGKFEIPNNGITGEYTLYTDMDYEEDSKFYDEIMDEFEWNELSISVEEYKRPTFEVNFEPVNDTYSVNDTVTVIGLAESFSGAKITGGKVSYAVQRVVQLPPWHYNSWRYSPPIEITSGETTTDEDGKYSISFPALPDSNIDKVDLPVFTFEITAAVTDISGETRENKTTVKVGYHQLEASLSLPDYIDQQKIKETKLTYQINNLNGQPAGAQGEISIYPLIGPNTPLRVRPWNAPDLPIISKEEFNRLFPHEVFSNQSDWKSWPKGEKIKSYDFDSTTHAFKMELFPTGSYVAELLSNDERGNEIKALTYFKVFDSKNEEVSDNQIIEIKTEQSTHAVGDQVKLKIGTASSDLTVVLDIDKEHEIKETKVIHLSNEVKTITIPVNKEDANGFAIHYYLVNYNSFVSGTQQIRVRKPEDNIQLETITFRDKIMPGNEETWAFKVIGNKKERKEVEILASMYDASLDQFKAHKWQFNPSPDEHYYAYNPNGQRCFINDRFNVRNLRNAYRYYRYPKIRHNEFNWFGFSISNNRANNIYLQHLRQFDLNQKSVVNIRQDVNRKKGYIYGTITSVEDGSPLPGVNVVIKGTTTGTVTDIDGQYAIPYSPGDELVISFIGYATESVKLNGKNIVDVQLGADVQQLSEVVVTAYGQVAKKQLLTGSVAAVQVDLDMEVENEEVIYQFATGEPGAASQIRIRGNSSINGSDNPLYVVDGVVVTDGEISADSIAGIQVLKGSAATSLYGAQAANGVVIISTKSGQKKLDEMLAKVEARTDLRETAFFYPHLETNKKGEISFLFDAPETLTRWKLQLMAHNKQLITGYKALNTITQKELMVVPNAPRFLRKGDEIELAAKVVNLTEQPQQVQIRLSLFDAETNTEISDQLIAQQNKSLQVPATGSNSITWTFDVSDNYNALLYKIVATNGTYSDGEQKIIPILSNRQLVTETLPITVKGNESKDFELKKLTDNQSSSLEHHKVTLEVTSNPIWNVIKSLPYLIEYPYECSEQTFARLYANLLAAEIVNKNDAIKAVFDKWKSSDALISNLEKNSELKALLIQETPWLREAKSETEQQKRIGLLFDLEKVGEQAKATFDKLYQMQFNDGGFPWFSGSNFPNRYITQHILTGFGHLKHLRVKPEFSGYDWMVLNGVKYLDKEIVKDYKNLIKDSTADYHSKNHINDLQLQYLYMRSFFDQKKTEATDKAITFYTKQAENYWTDFSLMSKAMAALILYRQGKNEIAQSILQSLEENSIVSEEMGMYWKANDGGFRWNEAKIETQALLIEAFQEIKSDTIANKNKTINELKNWLIKHKQVNSWKTTKATTEAVFAILLNEKLEENVSNQVKVQVGNQEVTPTDLEAGTGYFKQQWNKEAIKPELGKVSVSNNGEKLAYGSLYWQYFEDMDAITSSSTSALQLTKKLFKVTQDSQGEVLKAVNDTTKLQLGDLIRIRITLNVDRDMEFLHMKDQRASGFEPTTTLSQYKWQDGLGYYQSTRDASTNFFFDYVPKGVYVFEYDLRVNNKGSFTNGITTIESMYAPEFGSHSESIRVVISEE